MGYITISGDSDGDLHTADLHNKKFGAIASVLNGNIELDNLKQPSSEYTINSSGIYNGSSWLRFANAAAGLPTGEVATNTASHYHSPISSIVRIPFAATFTDNVTLSIVTGPNFSSGNNVTYTLQRTLNPVATPGTGAWTNVVGSLTSDTYTAALGITTLSFATNSVGIAAGAWVRVMVQNASTNPTYPPSLTMTMRLKTLHV